MLISIKGYAKSKWTGEIYHMNELNKIYLDENEELEDFIVHTHARGENGITPLHVSALSGSNEAMALLIQNGADINARNKDGATPLHAAALTGQAEAVKLLIANGADVSAKNNEGMTAEQMAFQNGHQSIVNLLGQHINQ